MSAELANSAGVSSVLASYDALVAGAELQADPEQRRAAEQLDRLATELERPKAGFFQRLIGEAPLPPRGVYLWGAVGRGKSMLMDLFVQHVGVASKRRAHFHEIMLDVHDRVHRHRQQRGVFLPRALLR